jgi:hypothetical protein
MGSKEWCARQEKKSLIELKVAMGVGTGGGIESRRRNMNSNGYRVDDRLTGEPERREQVGGRYRYKEEEKMVNCCTRKKLKGGRVSRIPPRQEGQGRWRAGF